MLCLNLGDIQSLGLFSETTTKADSYDWWLIRIPQMSQVLLLPWKVTSPSVTTCLELFSPVSEISFNLPHLLLRETVGHSACHWQKIALEVFGKGEEEDEKDCGEDQDNFEGASHRQL